MNDLKRYRLEHNLTQKEMAVLLQTSESYYSLIENGRKIAGINMRKRICKVLKTKKYRGWLYDNE